MSTIKVTNLQNPSASSAALVLNTDGTCSQLGVRNAIINGNPIINQRGYVSGTATSGTNQYTLDRWRVVTSGQSITWTDSGNVRTVTAPAGGVEQVIEGINLITGTYTLNWTGTATATVAGNAVTKGGNVSITGGTDTTVRFSSGTVSLVQFEPGTVATPFERRSYGAELALCQRYFFRQSFNAPIIHWGGTNAGQSGHMILFPVEMRTAPTATGDTSITQPTYSTSVGTLPVNNAASTTSNYSSVNFSSPSAIYLLVLNNASASTIFSVFGAFTASAEL